jgi:hypothetical protein
MFESEPGPEPGAETGDDIYDDVGGDVADDTSQHCCAAALLTGCVCMRAVQSPAGAGGRGGDDEDVGLGAERGGHAGKHHVSVQVWGSHHTLMGKGLGRSFVCVGLQCLLGERESTVPHDSSQNLSTG